jgi:hypothetical protein
LTFFKRSVSAKRLNRRRPAALPQGEKAGPIIIGFENELAIPTPPGLFAVGRQEIGPARREIAADVLDDDGDDVRVLAGRLEKRLIRNLIDRLLGEFLLLAKGENDVFEVSGPDGHVLISP